jgi:hypothetical protein
MEVKVTPPPPPPPPPSTYDITGLSEDEVIFLRDLCGRFSCSYPSGETAHFHSTLFFKLDRALNGDRRRKYTFTDVGSGTHTRLDPILQCRSR